MAKKDYVSMAKDIIDAIGGKENLSNAAHCMTRLRLQLNDSSKMDSVRAKEIPNVLNVIANNGEFQFVIGQDVPHLYREILNYIEDGLHKDNKVVEKSSKTSISETKTKGKTFEKIFSFIGGVFSPIIPVLVAGRITGAVLTLLTNFAGVTTDSGTYKVLLAINQAALYFLPVFVGFSVANKLNSNGFLGGFLAVILLFSGINGVEGLDFFGIGIQPIAYNANIFPVILGVLFMSFIYKFLQEHTIDYLKTILVPLLTMLITVPVTLVVLGPIGNTAGIWLCKVLLSMYRSVPAISVAIVGATTCWMVFFGMNNATWVPLLLLMQELGHDPLILAGMAAANVAVGGACLAAGVIAKKPEKRSTAIGAGITALCGITEPGVYGVLFVEKFPLVGAMIGGGVAGFIGGSLGMTQYVISSPGFISFASYITPSKFGGGWRNLTLAMSIMIFAVVLAFISTLILGKRSKAVAA